MFYFPQGNLDIRTPECSSSSVKYAPLDHCTDATLVTQGVTKRKGWRIIPTGTSLSAGTDMDRKVSGRREPVSIYYRERSIVRLGLEETLVVGNTDLFKVLIGNRQMKSVADSLTRYPTAQLHVYPNLLESTGVLAHRSND